MQKITHQDILLFSFALLCTVILATLFFGIKIFAKKVEQKPALKARGTSAYDDDFMHVSNFIEEMNHRSMFFIAETLINNFSEKHFHNKRLLFDDIRLKTLLYRKKLSLIRKNEK